MMVLHTALSVHPGLRSNPLFPDTPIKTPARCGKMNKMTKIMDTVVVNFILAGIPMNRIRDTGVVIG